MAVFANLGKNLKEIEKFIVTDDTMKKLLVNNSDTALTDPVPSIPIKDYFDKYLFRIQKLPAVQDEVKTFICMEFVRARKAGANNTYQYTVELHVDLLTHNDTWDLKGEDMRIYTMADVFDRKLKTLKIDSIKGEFTFVSFDKIVYDSDGTWQGRRLIYSLTDSSKNCGD